MYGPKPLSTEGVALAVTRRDDVAVGVANLEVQRATGVVVGAETHPLVAVGPELADLDGLAHVPELLPAPARSRRRDDDGAILLDTASVVAVDLVAVRHGAEQPQLTRGLGDPGGTGTVDGHEVLHISLACEQ